MVISYVLIYILISQVRLTEMDVEADGADRSAKDIVKMDELYKKMDDCHQTTKSFEWEFFATESNNACLSIMHMKHCLGGLWNKVKVYDANLFDAVPELKELRTKNYFCETLVQGNLELTDALKCVFKYYAKDFVKGNANACPQSSIDGELCSFLNEEIFCYAAMYHYMEPECSGTFLDFYRTYARFHMDIERKFVIDCVFEFIDICYLDTILAKVLCEKYSAAAGPKSGMPKRRKASAGKCDGTILQIFLSCFFFFQFVFAV